MDISVSSLTATETEAVGRLTDHVVAGNDLALYMDDAAGLAMLDRLADGLTDARSRVLRVSAAQPGGLSLSGLMAQVTGEPDLTTQDDRVLQLGFAALTVLDAACERIVLLVSDAHALERTALRYIQFAGRSANSLRLVFAGRPGFLETSEFAQFRARLTAVPLTGLAMMAPAVSSAAAAAPPPEPAVHAAAAGKVVHHAPFNASMALVEGPGQRRDRRLWAVVGLGMAASVALGVVIGRSVLQPTPASQDSMVANAPSSPALAPASALASAEPVARLDAVPDATVADPPVESSSASATAPTALDLPDPAPGIPDRDVPTLAEAPPALPSPASEPNLPAAALAPIVAPALAPPSGQVAAQSPVSIPAAPETPPRDDPAFGQRSRKRVASVPSRLATRPRAVTARGAAEPGEDYVPSSSGPSFSGPSLSDAPSNGWRSPAAEPEPAIKRPPAYIGTYTSGGDGIRTFRFGP